MKNRGKVRRLISILFISLFLIQVLPSAITATYTPASSIYLQKGNEVSTPNTPLGTFASNVMVMYLGTITITKGANETYYIPLLVNYFTADHIYVHGPHKGWTQQYSEFQVHAKNSMQSQANKIWLADTTTPLYNWSKTPITDNPYIVDLFLVSLQPPSRFDEDGLYSIPAGSLGSFNITVYRDSNQNILEYISVNGQNVPPGGGPPASTTPIPGAGVGAEIPGIPVGEEPLPLMFQVDIQPHSPFNLNQAYGDTGVKVATTQIFVINGQEGTNYNLKIKFTNPQNSSNFTLRPAESPYGYAIPYKMRFGTQDDVKGGTLYDWNNLSPTGNNYREIYVYKVDEAAVGHAPAGVFEDTILVEIFNNN